MLQRSNGTAMAVVLVMYEEYVFWDPNLAPTWLCRHGTGQCLSGSHGQGSIHRTGANDNQDRTQPLWIKVAFRRIVTPSLARALRGSLTVGLQRRAWPEHWGYAPVVFGGQEPHHRYVHMHHIRQLLFSGVHFHQ